MKTIDNIDQIIAIRDLCRQIIAENGLNLDIFEVVYPNKNLPSEFLLVKSIVQSHDGRPISDGTIEICIYAANHNKADNQSQPNLHRLAELTSRYQECEQKQNRIQRL